MHGRGENNRKYQKKVAILVATLFDIYTLTIAKLFHNIHLINQMFGSRKLLYNE
jgi:hypothetical protein